MLKHQYRTSFICCISSLLLACVNTGNASDPLSPTQQTAGKSERFSQFELDIAFRKQIGFEATFDKKDEQTFYCCALFYNDVKTLSKVFAHFEKHVSEDPNNYGLIVQENEKHYIVIFSERYRESTQYLAGGYWTPGISDPGLRLYSYLVDRKTLEILEFIEVPS